MDEVPQKYVDIHKHFSDFAPTVPSMMVHSLVE